ncbi:MAG: hypothetical protein HY905_09900 [Deltaproteobacteria bacterium]|nr:hypothetical protein [Deltaproteobacteria bacterium]
MARRRWTVVDYALAAALAVSCAVLGWQVYRTYFSRHARALRPPSAGDLCARLRDRGDVLALGRDSLPSCALRGTRLRTPADLTPDDALEELLSARDDDAVADLLAAKGVRTLVVATSLANPSLLPKVTVRNRLALFKPSGRFHALYLSEAAGLFEIVPGMLQVSDEEGTALLRLARAELAGTGDGGPRPPGLDVAGDFEVGLQFQGLRPETGEVPAPADKPNRKAYTRRTRPAVFAGGRGRSLAEAVRLAARNLREVYAARKLGDQNGPLEQALPRLTLEVEVFYDWTDVGTFTTVPPPEPRKPADPGERRYRSFLWRSFELGLHGIALGRDTDHYRFRLPSDAVYAGREEVEDLLSRVSLDLLTRDQDALQEAQRASGKPKGTAGDLSKVFYRTDPQAHVQRFRAHHFRETAPGGDVVRLARGIPPVPFAPETVGREALKKSIYWATRWLVENVQPDGRFHYRYFPETDHYLSDEQVVEDYNEVRHGLATYSLFMSGREVPSDDLRAAAEKSLRWILDSVVFGPAWTEDPARRARLPSWVDAGKAFGPPGKGGTTGPTDFWRCQHGYRRPIPRDMAYVRHLDNAKMGAVAAAVLPVSEKILRTPEVERPAVLELYRPFLEGFASFLLFMQHTSGPDAGMCDHYFVTPDNASYKRSTTIYPGEILFGLSRIYRLTGDPRIPPAFAMAVEYERGYFERESAIREPDGTYFDPRRADLVQFVPWISMAMNDMVIAIADEDPQHAKEYSDFGIRVSEWVVNEYLFDEARSFFPEYLGGYFKWEFELPAMHSMVYAEGTAAAFDLAKRAGDPREEAMRRATILGCRFAAQQIVVPGRNDHFMPDPARARGGVRFGINDSDMRTDFSYHTLSALNQTLRYMTDEELAPW